MTRTFIYTKEFEKNWESFGLSEDTLRRLELEIINDPKSAPVIRGTGGLRKKRFKISGKGKSGGIRVCYVDFEKYETIFMITTYPKSKKDNLSMSECSAIKNMLIQLEESLKR